MTVESMHFRVEYLLREAVLKPELAGYYYQMAAEWMIKGYPECQVRARTYTRVLRFAND